MLLQEFCTNRNVSLRIDRAAGLLRGVKLLGITSRNGREYPDAVLQRAARLYEGAKVNVNHPKGHPLAPRDYQDRLGTIHNVEARTGEGLFGDLQFNPKHALAEQLLWDAEHAPENVGFSHNVQARTAKRGDQTIVEDILAVQSVDLVADPATTRGLFESATAEAGDDLDQLERVGEGESRRGEELSPTSIENSPALPFSTSGALQPERASLTESPPLPLSKSPPLGRPGTWDMGPETLEQRCREQAEEVMRLRAEIDPLKAAQAIEHKRTTIAALLVEHGLPGLDRRDAAANAITSDSFVESLLAAPTEAAMRQLVRDRATVVEVAAATRWSIEPPSRATAPMSRDQTLIEVHDNTLDAFVKAIT
jgi:hypothetical protein